MVWGWVGWGGGVLKCFGGLIFEGVVGSCGVISVLRRI